MRLVHILKGLECLLSSEGRTVPAGRSTRVAAVIVAKLSSRIQPHSWSFPAKDIAVITMLAVGTHSDSLALSEYSLASQSDGVTQGI